MTTAGELRSGKGHRDENFPVASVLIDARHRGIILAFYEFVRVADDIADHATLDETEKLAQLDRLVEELSDFYGRAQPAIESARQDRGRVPELDKDLRLGEDALRAELLKSARISVSRLPTRCRSSRSYKAAGSWGSPIWSGQR